MLVAVVHGRDEERAAAVTKSIDGHAEVVVGDLATDAGADTVAAAAQAGGPIDMPPNLQR